MNPEESDTLQYKVGFTLDAAPRDTVTKIILQRGQKLQVEDPDIEELELNFFEHYSYMQRIIQLESAVCCLVTQLPEMFPKLRFLRIVMTGMQLSKSNSCFEGLRESFQKLESMTNLNEIQIFFIMTDDFSPFDQFSQQVFSPLIKNKQATVKKIKLTSEIIGAGIGEQFNKKLRIFSSLTQLRTYLSQEDAQHYSCIQQWTSLILFCHPISDPYLQFSKNKQRHQNNWLLPSISHISFPFLKIITFAYCKITSIERVSRLSAPVLKCIELNHNQIMSMSALTKIFSSQVEMISIQNNEIKEIEAIRRANWPILKIINCGEFLDMDGPVRSSYGQIEDLSPFLSARMGEKVEIICSHRKRITNMKTIGKFYEKQDKILYQENEQFNEYF